MTESKRVTHGKSRKIGSDLEKVDAYVLRKEDYDEIPELTDEWFEKATFHINGVPVPRGRPKSAHPKQHVNLRLDPDVVAHFRRGGPGWQSRINATLRKAAKLDAAKSAPRGTRKPTAAQTPERRSGR